VPYIRNVSQDERNEASYSGGGGKWSLKWWNSSIFYLSVNGDDGGNEEAE